jgi:diguanylate cyclase (GGDEF)-like protein/PAS domain S-box-containing protein
MKPVITLRNFSLRTQVGWAVGVILSLMFLIQALMMFSAARDALKTSLSGQLEVLVNRVAAELDDKVLMRISVLETMASKFPLDALKNDKEVERYFRDSPSLPTLIDDLYLFSAEGVLLVDWPKVSGRRGLAMAERDYITGVRKTGKTTISMPILGRTTRQPIIVIAVPILNAEGQLLGILGGVVNLQKSRLLEPLNTTRVGQTGYFFLVSSGRIMIAHPDPSQVLQSSQNSGINRMLDRAMTEGLEGVVEGVNSQSKQALFCFKRLPKTGWILAAELPSSEALSAVEQLRLRISVLTIFFWALTLVVILIMVRRFTRPLEILTNYLKSKRTLGPPPKLAQNSAETDRLTAAFTQFLNQQKIANDKLKLLNRRAEAANTDLRVAAIAFEAQEGMFITDTEGVILRINQAFTDITGYTAQEALGQTPRLLRSDRHDAKFFEDMYASLQTHRVWKGEIWNCRKNGDTHPEWLTITGVTNDKGALSHYVATITDISQRKAAEDEIQRLAFYDSLTHLPNRRLLLDRLHHALASSARTDRMGALLFIDLDNFKVLNDTLGHDQGDLLLKQVAQRLLDCVREGDSVARLGGDEFVIVLENLSQKAEESANQAERVGEKILTALSKAYDLAGHKYHNTPSIGITLFWGHLHSVDELMKYADLAMYEAKKAGRFTLRFFDPKMQATITARADLEKDLREGMLQEQFLLYYQPQVDAAGRTTGAEALLRWQHPQRGLVLPNSFILLAEETGLILPIGQWILETACQQLVAWARQPDTATLSIAVNISAAQLREPTFVAHVLAALQHSGAEPSKLKLELTESLLFTNVEETILRMQALQRIGVRFALDDFGTGYSSLSYLKRLPIDQLKIDQSFVHDLRSDTDDGAIVHTIVALAKSLRLPVMAEGVETEAQRDRLAALGCDTYQGFLFGPPLPVADFEQLLRQA